MDNLTHSLVGLAAARAGLEKLSPGATLLCVLAANSPDSDVIVLAFRDRWDYLQHHRGITHAVVGVIALAILMPLTFYAVDRLWSRLRKQSPKVKLKGLLLTSFIVSATHPLLDWTNNYGIRFWLPWSSKWSYGDLVFIVDPYMWMILGGAAFLLGARTKMLKFVWAGMAILTTVIIVASPRGSSLPNRNLLAVFWVVAISVLVVLYMRGARQRWGSKVAFVAFALVFCYWGLLAFAHWRAVGIGSDQASRLASSNGETVARLAAMPTVANPFGWDCVFETDRATYRFNLSLLSNAPPGNVVRYVKTPELKEIAEQRRPARIFLGFARFPVMQLDDPDCTSQTLVHLADLRYTEPRRSRGTFALSLPIDCPTQ
ncbi:MAG TPA: metal-dependent hydrolase [Pyrinomonadaceae bacterium]|nr:metal-dependent hydrolase [Pyrinomonadaceae bacterium]